VSCHPGAARTAKLSAPNLVVPAISGGRHRRDARLFLLALFLCCSLWFQSCGVQGPPQPPRVERPEPVKDLAVSQVGRTLRFTFALPQLTTDSERLTKPIEVRISRVVHPSGQNAVASPAEELWKVLQPDDVQRYARDGRLVYPVALSDQEFRQWRGATFRFSVSTLTRGFRHRPVESTPSNAVTATLLGVSGPVENLRVIPGENALDLTWSPPQRGANEAEAPEPSAYRIYRSQTGEPGSYELLGETASVSYADPDFEFDRPLFYKVRAVFRENGQVAESEDSLVVPITPHDIYPPAVPRGLSGIYTGEGVELIWAADVEADLAGYNVYRREGNGSFQKINPELLITQVFRDSSTQAGRSYFYRVTASDLTGNESSPSEEFSIETRYPELPAPDSAAASYIRKLNAIIDKVLRGNLLGRSLP